MKRTANPDIRIQGAITQGDEENDTYTGKRDKIVNILVIPGTPLPSLVSRSTKIKMMKDQNISRDV